jgi:hypothetical protein
MIRRLLADADLNGAIVSGVVRRNARLDFKRAEEGPLECLSVSHDITTMPDHFRAYIRHRDSPGVILVSQQARSHEQSVSHPESCDVWVLAERAPAVGRSDSRLTA